MYPKFSFKDKIGYTFGDVGNTSLELFRASYLTIFFTNVLKLNPVHVGILFLITKLWDSINDPLIGMIVDSRKPGKGGKFKPWIKYFSIPVAIMCVLCFLDLSNLDYSIRLCYAYLSYILYETMYTCLNVPFGSLASVMTDDPNERTDLSRYRSLGGTIVMTVLVIVGPLVLFVDNKPVPSRFTLLASILALVSITSFAICYRFCHERIQPTITAAQKINYWHTIKDILHNKAVLAMMLSSLAGIMAASIINGLNLYLFKEYFGKVSLMAVSGMVSTLSSIVAFVAIKPVAKKFGKKEWCSIGATFSVIVFVFLFLFPIKNPMIYIVINAICFLGISGFQILIWAMVNDCIDYHEYKTGKRQEAVVYTSYTFFRKLAGAFSSSAVAFTLAAIGYNGAATQQAAGVADTLWKVSTGSYVVGYTCMILITVFFYPLSKRKMVEVSAALKERRETKV